MIHIEQQGIIMTVINMRRWSKHESTIKWITLLLSF